MINSSDVFIIKGFTVYNSEKYFSKQICLQNVHLFAKCQYLQVPMYFITTILNLDFVQVSFNLLKHEMQLSGALSIGLMVEWTNSQFYLSQLFTY